MVGKSRYQAWQCVQVIADYVDSSEYFLQYAEDNSRFNTYLFILGNFGSGVIPQKSEDSSNFFRTLNRDLLGAMLDAGTGTARAYQVGYPSTPFVNCVEKVAFSPNGELLASTLSIFRDNGSIEKWVKLWNIATGEELHTFNDDFFFGFSEDGKTLAGRDWLWDIETKQRTQKIAENVDAHWSIALSPDFQTLVSFQRRETNFPTRIWNKKNYIQVDIPSLSAPFEPIHDYRLTQFSPDGRILAKVIGDYDRLLLCDVAANQQISLDFRRTGGCIGNLAFSPDGQMVAVALEQVEGFGSVYKTSWVDVLSIPKISGIKVLDAFSAFFGAKFIDPNASYDRRQLLASTKYSLGKRWIICLVDVATGRELSRIRVGSKFYGSFIHSLAFSPDSQTLACGHGIGYITLWQLSNSSSSLAAKKVCSFASDFRAEVKSLAFHPSHNQQILVSGHADGAIRMWRLR
ncbi:WD40 repeat domain-containing protein [Nostoc sp. UHCC 0870]|uniref:WD40 repeat domain-containing protein n=1 Tax=Nostoc sp. UHCC 0870 TaxID=2914041 RepID=UPI001EDC97C8|nr:WD40 repeat domain-containing protein [Nostoc sp. UHCC 0870]UKP01345.1 WD40 repeat domain-containing protein [Nostoc sp. UHCC 0870]